ncbi:translocation/assembly module TamB [Dokdonia sp. Hel_I_53]|uniref:translocation/assembly module TamB domain-containing protein n=1 Tax=Dokdonia sp. Hel_I_53 TaxID=1566287 RepID=UPI0011A1D00C|nr:translocation/assembly module TamB domain-containing protein [Dokdonia sp. Hel_I_53]
MTKETKDSEKKPQKKYKWLRIIGRILLAILLFLFLIIFFIRSEWGQDIIVNKVVNYLSDKTGTKVEIDKLFITYDGDVMLNGLYLEDKKGDTLIYSKSLEADVPLISMLRGGDIGVERLDWEGVRANIIRNNKENGFNFSFLSEALSSSNTSTKENTKQEESKPFNIELGDLYFNDFDVTYKDSITGIDSRYRVGELDLEMEMVDLESMTFSSGESLLKNATIDVYQYEVVSDSDGDSVPKPTLAFEELTLIDVDGNYTSSIIGANVDFDIENLYAIIPKADFENFVIDVNKFNLEDSKVDVKMITLASTNDSESSSSLFPDYDVVFEDILIQNTDIDYSVDGASPRNGVFNENAIAINDLNLKSPKIYLQNQTAGGQINRLTGVEFSGINVNQFSGVFKISDNETDLSNIQASINRSRLNGDIVLNYSSFEALQKRPENTRLDLDISSLQVYLREFYKFQPDLATNENFRKLSAKPIYGSVKASGTLANLSLPSLYANWGDATDLSASGSLQNVTDVNNLKFNLTNINANTTKNDLSQFVPTDSLQYNLPDTFKISGNAQGSISDFKANAILESSQGLVTVNGTFKNDIGLIFNADINIQDYALGELLNNDQIGNLSLKIDTNGNGSSINTLDANLEATIDRFSFRKYEINDLKLTGQVKNGKGAIQSKYKDDNLNIALDGIVVLDSIAPEATVNLNVVGANLQSLGLMKRDVRTGFKLNGYFKGNTTSYDAYATVNDGVFVYDDRTYLMGDVDFKAKVRTDSTAITFQNKIIDLDLRSNAEPTQFATALQDHVYSYFYRDAIIPDTIVDPVNIKLRGQVKQSPLLNEVFLVNMKDLDTVSIVLDFAQAERKLNASINAPHINYSGNELDSLSFSMKTNKDYFNFDLGFDAITAGPLAIKRTKISGIQTNNELSLDFEAYHDNETLINVSSEITGSRDRLRFHVLADSLTFNKKRWKVPQSNEIIITDKKLLFNNFLFQREGQSVEFTDKLPTIIKDHIAIDFQNFKLSELLSYLNPNKKLAQGNLSGDLVIEEPFGDIGFLADLYVERFGVLGEDLGVLELAGRSLRGNKYDFNMAIGGGSVDLTLEGDYVADVDGAQINMDLDLNEVRMNAIDGFSLGELKDGSGSFSGNFKMNGKLADLSYLGFLRFENAGFTVTKLNAPFILKRETISIDNAGITMDNFTLRDVRGNTLIASGFIGTESFLNPTFDLRMSANDFQALDAKEGDNDFLFGKAVFDATATIKGDVQIPIVNIDATVGGATDVTYIMPTATANIESSDGIVTFVNKENPDAILTRSEEETGTIVGFDINANLKINKEAQVTIIIDEETGDNLNVYGDGDFNFGLQPNGRMSLSGVYDVAGGKYEMNLYNLVNRTFTLDPSSRVSWSGDPFDAKLDVRAVYEVETSASGLMAPSISNDDTALKNQFRQVLPFLVYLNIDGELLSPSIDFALDLPEDEQGSLGGAVYAQVQQINQQESELNKQVFSLLVLNRFYPGSGSDGSNGGFATIARDNLNDALSDQLNIFSDKLLGNSGFNLDFGLDSFTDYSGTTASERTQLDIAASRKFFNDKLKVSVGSSVDVQGESTSGEGTPLIGNVSLEYELTEDGQYRLRGFRRSEYENVIDGQTIVNGISVIFQQEFNQFSELWDAILRKKQEELIEEEKAEKENQPSQEKIDANKID